MPVEEILDIHHRLKLNFYNLRKMFPDDGMTLQYMTMLYLAPEKEIHL